MVVVVVAVVAVAVVVVLVSYPQPWRRTIHSSPTNSSAHVMQPSNRPTIILWPLFTRPRNGWVIVIRPPRLPLHPLAPAHLQTIPGSHPSRQGISMSLGLDSLIITLPQTNLRRISWILRVATVWSRVKPPILVIHAPITPRPRTTNCRPLNRPPALGQASILNLSSWALSSMKNRPMGTITLTFLSRVIMTRIEEYRSNSNSDAQSKLITIFSLENQPRILGLLDILP